MKKSAYLLVSMALAAGLYGCAQFTGVTSLRGSDPTTVDVAPDAKPYAGRRPGMQQRIARTYEQQPPLVPHALENFDEITVSDNQCLECHAPDTAAKKGAPKVGDSHLTVDRLALRENRYQCNSCHVPQVDAPPLVPNNFVGHLKQAAK